jgi:hypothetical protein
LRGNKFLLELSRRLSRGTAEERVNAFLAAAPLVVAVLCACVYVFPEPLGTSDGAKALLGALVVHLYYLSRFFFRREYFRPYLKFMLSFVVVSGVLGVAWMYRALSMLNSSLVEFRSLTYVAVLCIGVVVYGLVYGWRVRWKEALPYHFKMKEIGAEEGVNIFVPLGHNAVWERKLVHWTTSGKAIGFFSIFGSLGIMTQGSLKGTTFTEFFYFSLAVAALVTVATTLPKYVWFFRFLNRYEKEIGHPLKIQGM